MSVPKTPAEALAEAKRLVNQRNAIRQRGSHAAERKTERSVRAVDLQSAINTCTRAEFQADRRTWKLSGGVDTDGDELVVVLDFDEVGAWLVTVF